MSFSAEELDLIGATKEPIIETRSGERVYRTVIWVVVEHDEVYVRSFLGEDGKWYQRAIADPEIVLDLGDRRIAAVAVPATDAESIERASAGFIGKYRKGRSLDAMVREEVLDTTLRLEPLS